MDRKNVIAQSAKHQKGHAKRKKNSGGQKKMRSPLGRTKGQGDGTMDDSSFTSQMRHLRTLRTFRTLRNLSQITNNQ